MPLYIPDPDADPTQLVEDLARALTNIYNGIEVRLQQEIARRLYRGLDIYADLFTRLRALGELDDFTAAVLGQIDTDALARNIIATAFEAGTAAAVSQLGLARHLPRELGITTTAQNAAAALAMDLTNKLEDLHLRILRYPADAFQAIVAQYTPQVLVGGASLRTLERATVQAFLAEGITNFPDAAGRRWRIGSYAEMATRTATMRAWQDAGIERMRQSGITAVDVVIGRSGCERCSAWRGKTLSIDGVVGSVVMPHAITGEMVVVHIDDTLDHARSTGFQHPNCRCRVIAHLPGLRPRPDATTFDPKRSKDQERLRMLERRVREAKREAALAPDAAAQASARKDIRDAQAAIREHVAETGLLRRNHREQLHFADGGTKNPRG